MKIKKILPILFSTMFFVSAMAQGFDTFVNPQISVTLNHPPSLGLKSKKIVFNPATGNCSDQIIDQLISDFIENKVEVIDRNNLEAILSEHKLRLSGYLDKNSAISIGNIIGPSAMITIKVLRCVSEKKFLYVEDKYTHKTDNISRTMAYLKVSVQITDLTTGRIFTARVLDYSPFKENRSTDGIPPHPSEFEVQEVAFQKLTSDVHKMFFPWSESKLLYFFDNKKGGLKQAFLALQAGDTDEAFELSKKNLGFCQANPVKPKILAHAYYNVGMMHFIKNDYDEAIKYFQSSRKIRPGEIVTKSIAECKKAKSLETDMQKFDEKVAIDLAESNNKAQKAQKARAANTLTNADIISLTKKKLPKNLILQKIKTSTCNFDTSTDALVKLTNAGVSEEVVMLMMEQ